MSANTASTMSAARRAQADEFYTRREEIEAEMAHYRERFRGARVLLNADDPPALAVLVVLRRQLR